MWTVGFGVRFEGFGWEKWMTVRGGCGGGGRVMGGVGGLLSPATRGGRR